MDRWVSIVLSLPFLVSTVGCQASLTHRASAKSSFDRVYELSPPVAAYVDKALFARMPRRVAVLPFIYKPDGSSRDTSSGEPEEEGSVPGKATSSGPGEFGPLVKTIGDGAVPGGFSPEAELVRRAFFGQFAALPFEDIEPVEVERKLSEAGIVTPEQLLAAEPRWLGSLLEADALVYGTVHEMSVAYLVLYSQIAVGLSVKLVAASDGKVLWHVDHVGRKHTIQVAMGPVGLVTGAVRSGLVLRPINVTRTAEDLSRDIVQTFPSRASLARLLKEPYEILSVELEGPKGPRRYGEAVWLRVAATPGRRAWFDLDHLARHVALQEVETGLYQGRYVVSQGDQARQPMVTVYLGPPDSPQYYRWVQKRLDLVIDAVPPNPPDGVRVRREGGDLMVMWESSSSRDLEGYRLYRRGPDGEIQLVGSTDSTTYLVSLRRPLPRSLVVTAVDWVGNESAGVEVLLRP